MRVRIEHLIVVLLMCATLGFRLACALSTPQFSDSTSYFNLRQVEAIRDTGLPLYNDPLSYSGRLYIFLPLFHYVLAACSLFVPLYVVAKILPQLLICTLVPLSYLITVEITKSKEAGIATACLSGFIPVVLYETVNSVSVYALALPLTLAVLYLLMKIGEDDRYVPVFLAAILLMALTDPSVFLLLLSQVVYLFFLMVEKLRAHKAETEVILFSSFFVIWLTMLLFKNVFLSSGPSFLWQGIPAPLLETYFPQPSLLEATYLIGAIPFLCGMYVIYRHLLVEKNRQVYLLVSFALSTFILIWLRWIPLKLGLVYFSLLLTLLFGQLFKIVSVYITHSRLANLRLPFIGISLAIFAVASIMPSVQYSQQAVAHAVSPQEIEALHWIRDNTPQNATVLASLDEGHLITGIAQRKNVMDSNFVLAKNAEQTVNDARQMYVTPFETDAIRLLNKYRVDYVIVSDFVASAYNLTRLPYASDEACFEIVYDRGVLIYRSLCTLEEEQ